MKSPIVQVTLALLFCHVSNPIHSIASTRLMEQDRIRIREQLKLDAWNVSDCEEGAIHLLVLDNGFAGYEDDLDSLGKNTQYYKDLTQWMKHGDKNQLESKSRHGWDMALIVDGITKSEKKIPVKSAGTKDSVTKIERWLKIDLANANHRENFTASCNLATQMLPDFVLNSNVWPGFGDGFEKDRNNILNQSVSEYTRRGGIWINSSGDYEGRFLKLPIELIGDSNSVDPDLLEVRIPHERREKKYGKKNTTIEVRSYTDQNEVKFTLSWNDFGDINHWPKVDLDLFMFDQDGRLVGKSENIQNGEPKGEHASEEFSKHPRETIVVTLKGPDEKDKNDGEKREWKSYWVKIKAKSRSAQVIENGDYEFRLLMSPTNPREMRMLSTSEGNDLYPPATNEDAITVSDYEEGISTVSKNRSFVKSDIYMPNSYVGFTNSKTKQIDQSSVSAPMLLAVAATIKAKFPQTQTHHFKKYFKILADKQLIQQLLMQNFSLIGNKDDSGVLGKESARWGHILKSPFLIPANSSANSIVPKKPLPGAGTQQALPLRGQVAAVPPPPPVEMIDRIFMEMIQGNSDENAKKVKPSVLKYRDLSETQISILEQLRDEGITTSDQFILYDQTHQIPTVFTENNPKDLSLFDKLEVPTTDSEEEIYWVVERTSKDSNTEWNRYAETEKGMKNHTSTTSLAFRKISDFARPVLWETPLPHDFERLVLRDN